jgi:hypothetical protein
MSHRGVAFDVAEKSSLSTTKEPPFLPSRFNERDRCPVLELVNDGMDAKFAGPAKGTDSDAASVRAEHPIPSSCGIYYYEVTIVSRGSQGYILDQTNLDSSVWDSVVRPSRWIDYQAGNRIHGDIMVTTDIHSVVRESERPMVLHSPQAILSAAVSTFEKGLHFTPRTA